MSRCLKADKNAFEIIRKDKRRADAEKTRSAAGFYINGLKRLGRKLGFGRFRGQNDVFGYAITEIADRSVNNPFYENWRCAPSGALPIPDAAFSDTPLVPELSTEAQQIVAAEMETFPPKTYDAVIGRAHSAREKGDRGFPGSR